PVGSQDQQVTAEPVLHPGGLVRRADGQQVRAQPCDLLCQPLVAEAVAVALADRDQPGELLLHVLVVRPPARGVDVERERHGRTWTLSRGCGVSGIWELSKRWTWRKRSQRRGRGQRRDM